MLSDVVQNINQPSLFRVISSETFPKALTSFPHPFSCTASQSDCGYARVLMSVNGKHLERGGEMSTVKAIEESTLAPFGLVIGQRNLLSTSNEEGGSWKHACSENVALPKASF